MMKENQAEFFMRILAEELAACRAAGESGLSRQFKMQARRLGRHRSADDTAPTASAEPLDCLQLMSATPERAFSR